MEQTMYLGRRPTVRIVSGIVVGLILAAVVLAVLKWRDNNEPHATLPMFSGLAQRYYLESTKNASIDRISRWRRRVQKHDLSRPVMSQDVAGDLLRLVATKDHETASQLQARIRRECRRENDSSYAWLFIWAVFEIEEEAAAPFLIECLSANPSCAEAASLQLQRLSFHMATVPFEGPQNHALWDEWWQTHQGMTWDDNLIEAIHLDGKISGLPPVMMSRLDREFVRRLIEAYPLQGNDFQDLPKDFDKGQLIAMRVAQLFEACTDAKLFPISFPLGYPELWHRPADYGDRVAHGLEAIEGPGCALRVSKTLVTEKPFLPAAK